MLSSPWLLPFGNLTTQGHVKDTTRLPSCQEGVLIRLRSKVGHFSANLKIALNRFLSSASGGLFQDFAPSAYHMQHVILPILGKLGIKAQLAIIRPGYVPRGG